MFNDEKILAAAKKLGLEIEFESENPGLLFLDENREEINFFSFENINSLFNEKFNKDFFKKNSIKLEEKIEIRKELKNNDVKEFKDLLKYGQTYSTKEGKSTGSFYYNYNNYSYASIKVSTNVNQTDKAA